MSCLGYIRVLVLVMLPVLLLAACVGSAHYQKPPHGAIEHGTGAKPVKPDWYKVKSEEYPKYIASQDFKPPSSEDCWIEGCSKVPQTKIREGQIWEVTHVLGERYIIQSKEYNLEQCRYLAGIRRSGYRTMGNMCFGDKWFSVYITKDGRISGGWELLPRTAGGTERYMYLNPDPAKNEGWPEGQVFIPGER